MRIWFVKGLAGVSLMVFFMAGSGIRAQAGEAVRSHIYDRFLTCMMDTGQWIVDENSRTKLADGSYTPDKFGYSGGTGRVAISCQKVTVRKGRAYAALVFDSGSYSYVRVNGSVYEGTNTPDASVFEIPVQLNQNTEIVGCTTKMSSAHEIAYSIFVYVEGAMEGDKDRSGNEEASLTEKGVEPPKLEGLTFEKETKAENAGLFRIFHYEGGIACIETDIRYLIVPDDAELPAGLDKESVIIRRPGGENKEGVFRAYAASEPVLGWMSDLGQLKNLALSGIPEEECRIQEIRELMEEEKAAFGGTYDEIEYRTLVTEKCDLALMPAEIISSEKDAKGREYLGELGIPMFVDLSSLEASKEGKAEWIKVYGVLFDCEEEAGALYREELEKIIDLKRG